MAIGQVIILVHSLSTKIELGKAFTNFTSRFEPIYAKTFNPDTVFGFWDLTIGVCFMCLYLYGANHAAVMRILSAQSDRTARQAAWIVCAGLIFILIIGLGFGFVINAFHHENGRPDGLVNDQETDKSF